MSGPTIRDVAARAGVSVATVSRFLSDPDKVARATREKVEAAMSELGWRPNMTARSLVHGRTGLYGVIVPDVANPFFGELATGMSLAASSLGVQLVLLHTDLSEELDVAALHLCRQHRLDAVIYTSGSLGPAHRTAVAQLGRPVVLAATYDPEDTLPGILVDSQVGGKMGARHLLSLGHRRIALVGGPAADPIAAGPRWTGWRLELAAAGCLPPPHWQLEVGWKQQYGYQAAIALLREPIPPTAILCGSDVLALGVLAAAADLGVSVPHDLSVVGFDGLNLASLWRPSLTTLSQPIGDIGREAVRLAVSLTEGHAAPPTRWLTPELVVRGSTSAAVR
ncbi:MAG: catabolite control protein [Symbiobacteriaceae bacterium]|nr:catabolite control protein [Symbiobacteriaceae bacterium]